MWFAQSVINMNKCEWLSKEYIVLLNNKYTGLEPPILCTPNEHPKHPGLRPIGIRSKNVKGVERLLLHKE